MTKTITTLLLAAVLSVSLIGCGATNIAGPELKMSQPATAVVETDFSADRLTPHKNAGSTVTASVYDPNILNLIAPAPCAEIARGDGSVKLVWILGRPLALTGVFLNSDYSVKESSKLGNYQAGLGIRSVYWSGVAHPPFVRLEGFDASTGITYTSPNCSIF